MNRKKFNWAGEILDDIDLLIEKINCYLTEEQITKEYFETLNEQDQKELVDRIVKTYKTE